MNAYVEAAARALLEKMAEVGGPRFTLDVDAEIREFETFIQERETARKSDENIKVLPKSDLAYSDGDLASWIRRKQGGVR